MSVPPPVYVAFVLVRLCPYAYFYVLFYAYICNYVYALFPLPTPMATSTSMPLSVSMSMRMPMCSRTSSQLQS